MIYFNKVTKLYPPNSTALKEISFNVKQGEFVFLTGKSGAGKSTLLKLIFAAERPSSGDIIVGGRNLNSVGETNLTALRREIGVVFQNYNLILSSTVQRNVEIPLEIRGISRRERAERTQAFLHKVGLYEKRDALPNQLSGGEQQRVAIARALVYGPKLIIADEPTGNLDSQMTNTIFDLLTEANKRGVTVFVATHNEEVVKRLNKKEIRLN